jgi:Ubiquitin carboxyl-terminal hydrolase
MLQCDSQQLSELCSASSVFTPHNCVLYAQQQQGWTCHRLSFVEHKHHNTAALCTMMFTQCSNATEHLSEAAVPYDQHYRTNTITYTHLQLPDILVIHMKRFHHSSRYREKLKTLVVFPQAGLDMGPFKCSESPYGTGTYTQPECLCS